MQVNLKKMLKEEMFDDLRYIQSLKKELDELQSDKADFSNEYDLLLQECLSKDILCVAFSSISDIDEYFEMACKYIEKVKECECLKIELSKQKDTASKEDYHKLRGFSKPRSVTKTDVSKGLSKPVTPQNLPQTQTGKQAEINKNVIKPGMYRLDTRPIQTRTPQFP
ncbi:hypothetical protein Tco_1131786 [Tanacetum coccineum]|uniref:Uncharacterized protein n=1 Tax=Tanacetum coccineum TaxID=301880 RepID=A0ABQ5JA28_9ASTR